LGSGSGSIEQRFGFRVGSGRDSGQTKTPGLGLGLRYSMEDYNLLFYPLRTGRASVLALL